MNCVGIRARGAAGARDPVAHLQRSLRLSLANASEVERQVSAIRFRAMTRPEASPPQKSASAGHGRSRDFRMWPRLCSAKRVRLLRCCGRWNPSGLTATDAGLAPSRCTLAAERELPPAWRVRPCDGRPDGPSRHASMSDSIRFFCLRMSTVFCLSAFASLCSRSGSRE